MLFQTKCPSNVFVSLLRERALTLCFTAAGHSLGGAVATLAAYDLLKKYMGELDPLRQVRADTLSDLWTPQPRATCRSFCISVEHCFTGAALTSDCGLCKAT
jgi:pimeloyl-ACP methyl ester carboxylesterase